MNVIDSVTQDLLDKTEFLAIVTQGPDDPHLAGNWGDYLRRIGLEGTASFSPLATTTKPRRTCSATIASRYWSLPGRSRGAMARARAACCAEPALS